jgi:hypothetical protein
MVHGVLVRSGCRAEIPPGARLTDGYGHSIGGSAAAAEARPAQEWQPIVKRRAGMVDGWGGRWLSAPACSPWRGVRIAPVNSASWSKGGARRDLGVKAA